MKELMNIKDFIDVKVLQDIQDQFSKATGLASITVDQKGKPITSRSNFSTFCAMVRSDESLRSKCYQCDAHGGLQAAITGEPYFYKCHAGNVDFAVPITVQDTYLGAVLVGQVRIEEDDKKLPYIIESSEERIIKNPKLMEEMNKLNVTTYKKVKAAAKMMHIMTNYIVEKEYVNIMQEKLNDNNLKLMETIAVKSELESSLREAELTALRAQINPHFLFNVLNTIGRLALIENAGRTENMIYSFSDMMRYTLKKTSTDTVPLKEEINHVNNYLSIQKLRLGDRLDFEINIPEGLNEVDCPFMTIQPLVENSINHVVEKKNDGGRIIVAAEPHGDIIKLSICDNGDGMDDDIIENTLNGSLYKKNGNSGIGIYNVHKRLMYYFGPEGGLKIESTKGKGTKTIITLPRKNHNKKVDKNV
jgi:LytS/YehU family sensor histidine kinase